MRLSLMKDNLFFIAYSRKLLQIPHKLIIPSWSSPHGLLGICIDIPIIYLTFSIWKFKMYGERLEKVWKKSNSGQNLIPSFRDV
jgi:hypothetical protein